MFGRKSARTGVPKLDRTEKSELAKLEKLIDRATSHANGLESFDEIVASFQSGSKSVAREGVRRIRKRMKAPDSRHVMMSLKLADRVILKAPLARTEASSGAGGKKFCDYVLKLAIEHPEARIRSEAGSLITNWAETYQSEVALMPYFQTAKVELVARQAQGLPAAKKGNDTAAGKNNDQTKSVVQKKKAVSTSFANVAQHMSSSTPSQKRPQSDSIDSMDSQSTIGTSSMISAMPAGGMWGASQMSAGLPAPPESPPDTPPNLSEADKRLVRSGRSICEALHQVQGGDDDEIRNDLRSQARSTLENLRTRVSAVAAASPPQETLLESLIAQSDAVAAAIEHFENSVRSRQNTEDIAAVSASTPATSSGLVDFNDTSTENVSTKAATTLDDLFGIFASDQPAVVSTPPASTQFSDVSTPAPVTENQTTPAVKSKADEILSMFNTPAPIPEDVNEASDNESSQQAPTSEQASAPIEMETEPSIQEATRVQSVEPLPEPSTNPQLPAMVPSSPFDNELMRRKQDKPTSVNDENSDGTAFFNAPVPSIESTAEMDFSEFSSMQSKKSKATVDDAFVPLGEDPFAASAASKATDFSAFATSPTTSTVRAFSEVSIPIESARAIEQTDAAISTAAPERDSTLSMTEEQSIPSTEEVAPTQSFPRQPFPPAAIASTSEQQTESIDVPVVQRAAETTNEQLSEPHLEQSADTLQPSASDTPLPDSLPTMESPASSAFPPQPVMPASLPAPPEPPASAHATEQPPRSSEVGTGVSSQPVPPLNTVPHMDQRPSYSGSLVDQRPSHVGSVASSYIGSMASSPTASLENARAQAQPGFPSVRAVSISSQHSTAASSEQPAMMPQVEQNAFPPQPSLPITIPTSTSQRPSVSSVAVEPPTSIQAEQVVFPPQVTTTMPEQPPDSTHTETPILQEEEAAAVPLPPSSMSPPATTVPIQQADAAAFSAFATSSAPAGQQPPIPQFEQGTLPPPPSMPTTLPTPPKPPSLSSPALDYPTAPQPKQREEAQFPPRPGMPASRPAPPEAPHLPDAAAAFPAFAAPSAPAVHQAPVQPTAAFPSQPVMPAAMPTSPKKAPIQQTAAFPPPQPVMPAAVPTSPQQAAVQPTAAFPSQPVMPTAMPTSPQQAPIQQTAAFPPPQPVMPAAIPTSPQQAPVQPTAAFPSQPVMPTAMPMVAPPTLPQEAPQQTAALPAAGVSQPQSGFFPAPRQPTVSTYDPNDPFAELDSAPPSQPYVAPIATQRLPMMGMQQASAPDAVSPGAVSLVRVDTSSSAGSPRQGATATSNPGPVPAPTSAASSKKSDPFSELFSW